MVPLKSRDTSSVTCMYTCIHPPLYMHAYTLRENDSQRAFGRDTVALRIGWFTHNGAAIKATEDLIHPPSQGSRWLQSLPGTHVFIIGMANSAAVLKRCVWIPGWFSSNQRAGVSYNKCFIHNSWWFSSDWPSALSRQRPTHRV